MAGLYIHIPFCTQKCIYCDFMSGTNLGLRSRYIEALVNEMELYGDFFEGENLTTLYIGGGTPSLMTIDELRRICDAVAKRWDIGQLEEFTIECNPDDLSAEYLIDMLNMQRFYLRRSEAERGARLSIGVQSFNDEELKWLNRRHTGAEAKRAIESARKAGYKNLSIDLMFALPVQSVKSLNYTLDEALSLGVEHISAYSLMFEPGSKITKLMAMDRLKPQEEEVSAEMFEVLSSRLCGAGYDQYEISNYAIQGYESKHNSSYWHCVPYLGLGPSAHSFDGEKRWSNVGHTIKYCDAMCRNLRDREEALRGIVDTEIMSEDEKYNEMVFTALRTKVGLSLLELEKKFGHERYEYLKKQAKRFEESGHLEKEEGRLKLTHKGIYISDTIMSELMIVR